MAYAVVVTPTGGVMDGGLIANLSKYWTAYRCLVKIESPQYKSYELILRKMLWGCLIFLEDCVITPYRPLKGDTYSSQR